MTSAKDNEATVLQKIVRTGRWLPSLAWQLAGQLLVPRKPSHVIMALADHYEPSIMPETFGEHADEALQEERVAHWCKEYPRVADDVRDQDGHPFVHTYFYPAEQYVPGTVERLADHCHSGWGEIEIHLHHGLHAPSSERQTREALVEFRDRLAALGCLARWDGRGAPRYAFVHGNWALANSANGRFCGVDNEIEILADTGCYADMTLPSAPSPTQTAKINSIYEPRRPLGRRAAHRRGRDVRVGVTPETFPLIVQGPLGLSRSIPPQPRTMPGIENGAITAAFPGSASRMPAWRRANVVVRGRPDWLFIKLHCHGLDPRDEDAMVGSAFRRFLEDLARDSELHGYALHFVTAREMVNMILAAADGRTGSPGSYREYRLLPVASRG